LRQPRCASPPTRKLNLTNAAPSAVSTRAKDAYDEYISDPAKPVPFRQRPIPQFGYDEAKGQTWPRWLVDDQREASGRTDVLTYTTGVLTAPVKISGEPIANLLAATSGTDADWVVKLIDVYPDQVAAQPEMGGYQLMISADIFRGRYREAGHGQADRRQHAAGLPLALPTPTTCSCRATASWCRSSPAGSRCTTAIRRPSCRISSTPSLRITRKRPSASTTTAISSCRWSAPPSSRLAARLARRQQHCRQAQAQHGDAGRFRHGWRLLQEAADFPVADKRCYGC
jgi:hypothetical protein